MIRLSIAAFAILVIIASVVFIVLGGDDDDDENDWFAEPVADYPYAVQMFEAEIGAEGRHFAPGEFQGYGSVEYGTTPPTSGRHIGELVQQGVSELAVPNEVAVHNMEHGFVIVWYNCNANPAVTQDECVALRNDLTSVVQPAVSDGKLVVLSPNATMEHRIALTSWQFMDVLDQFDESRIQTFIETFECHYDPEGSCYVARPYLVVRASVDPSVMKEFDRWYRREHLPHVLEIPGVIKAYRSQCTRRGINWTTLYEIESDASVQKAISSPQADRARRDWEAWLKHVSDLSVEVYASLGPLTVFHHWN